jgi:hypothetical protein
LHPQYKDTKEEVVPDGEVIFLPQGLTGWSYNGVSRIKFSKGKMMKDLSDMMSK